MNEGEIISIQSHTIGSIGQLVKDSDDFDKEEKARFFDEIKRIYKGYIGQLNKLLFRKEE